MQKKLDYLIEKEIKNEEENDDEEEEEEE